MKTLILLLTITICSVSFAGPGQGHSHGHAAPAVSQEKAQELGMFHVERLTKPDKMGKSKIDTSWAKATFSKTEKKNFSGQMEWVVSFKNEKGVKGKILYIFLKDSGEFVAANFTGK